MKVNYHWRIFLETKKRTSAEKIWAQLKQASTQTTLTETSYLYAPIKFPEDIEPTYGIYFKNKQYLLVVSYCKNSESTADALLEACLFFSRFVYRYNTEGPIFYTSGFDMTFLATATNDRFKLCGIEMISLLVTGQEISDEDPK